MKEVILNDTDCFSSGAFLINDSQQQHEPFQGGNHLFLTQNSDSGLKTELIRLVEETDTVIKVCSFIITDKEIFEVLLAKAKSTNVAIFVLTQLDPSKLVNSSFLTEEESKEQSYGIHLSYIKILYEHGVHVRASTNAHAKFIVSDRKKGFIMTANLTTPSLTFNTESAVYMHEKCVESLDHLFDVIFQKGTSYRQYLNTGKKNKQLVVQNESNIKAEWLPKVTESNLRYTYEQLENNLYSEIISIIDSANTYLYMSSYSIVGLQNLSSFIESIKNAISRGVNISIFCRGMNFRSDHLKSCDELSSLGCKIYGDVFNHSKGILNEKTGLIFTANIDGNHGLINGLEVGLLLSEQQHSIMCEFHKHLIRTSPFIFKTTPNRKDLFFMYESLEKLKQINPPQFGDSLLLTVKAGVFIKKEEFEGQPLFYCRSKDANQSQYLMAGNSCYKVGLKDEEFTLFETAKPSLSFEKFILKYKYLKIQYN
ncbi:MAG: phosphatidylserine/phosphatidylglycerophosphate/cardiolipin synthase family protein [Bacteroidia bacterium]|nr:phosphatidylserine/phosphatidylglycerophosphate/cardiolipin synthase family protein [Bacteroidia bacterium]